MRSKTSCFNGTLFRKNLSRYWPLWGLASFGGAMFPLAMLLELLHNGFRFWSPLETRQAYYTVLSYGVSIPASLPVRISVPTFISTDFCEPSLYVAVQVITVSPINC